MVAFYLLILLFRSWRLTSRLEFELKKAQEEKAQSTAELQHQIAGLQKELAHWRQGGIGE